MLRIDFFQIRLRQLPQARDLEPAVYDPLEIARSVASGRSEELVHSCGFAVLDHQFLSVRTLISPLSNFRQ